MRRRFFIVILLAAIILPVVSVYAQTTPGTTGVTSGFKALAPIPGLTGDSTGKSTSVLSSDSLAEFFNNLYIYAIGLAAAIAVIQIIYAGLEIAFFNKDSVSKLMDSKGRIAQSIYGLILIFSPVVVFSIINPSILNLELNMQPLDTAPTTSATPGGGTDSNGSGGGSNAPGCTVTGTAGYLQKVTCKNTGELNSWFSASCSGRAKIEQESSCTTTGCTEQTEAYGYCGYPSTYQVAFVDIGLTAIGDYYLQPINTENATRFSSYESSCRSSGGAVCTLGGMKAKSASPCGDFGGYPDEKLPFGASGKCYQTYLACLQPEAVDRANSYLPTSKEALLNACEPEITFVREPIQ